MVKESIAAMGKSPNPLDMKGYIDTYNVVEANVARQLDRQMGPANPNDVGARNELIKAKVQAQLGDEAGYLLTVKQHGAEAAYKLDQANLSTSKSGQSGGPSAELQTSLDTALDTVAGNLKGVAAGSTVLSHLLTGQVFSDQTALQSHREAAADRLLTQTPGAPGTSSSIGQFFRNAVPGLGGDDRFTGGVTYSPEARAMLKQWGTVYSAVNGKAVKDQAGGKNAEEFIVNLGLEKLAPVLEAKMSPDGKNAVIGLKTFNTVLTDGLGLKKPLSADAEQGYLADFVAQERIRTGQMPLDFDRKTAMAVPVLDSNNQLTFHISVSDRQGIPVTQMTIAKDDPRLSASNLALDKAILGTIYDIKPGMSPSDAVHAASGLGRFIAGTKDYLFRQGRIERVLAGGIGGRATENTTRHFLTDSQTRLQGLDNNRPQTAPGAAEALQQMIKGPDGAGRRLERDRPGDPLARRRQQPAGADGAHDGHLLAHPEPPPAPIGTPQPGGQPAARAGGSHELAVRLFRQGGSLAADWPLKPLLADVQDLGFVSEKPNPFTTEMESTVPNSSRNWSSAA